MKPDCMKVEKWSEFIPSKQAQRDLAEGNGPYAFVRELYEMRREAKSQKTYDIIELAIKLCINSLYGKTAQRIGGTETEAPKSCCPYYAAAITAWCRAQLLWAALTNPYAVVSFMTDGIISSEKLGTLPNEKEVFEAGPAEGTIVNLGDWECLKLAGGYFLQSGVYSIHHVSGKPKDRTRGTDPHKFLLKMNLSELFERKIYPAWAAPFDLGNPYHLEIPMRTFITAGAAVASKDRFRLIGRWSEIRRRIDIHTFGVKRDFMPLELPELYLSVPPRETELPSAATVNGYQFILPELTYEEIAGQLVIGRSFRCDYLVPTAPALNPTPDLLSAPCLPDWLDPEIDDDEGAECLGLFGPEAQDTHDILVGNS